MASDSVSKLVEEYTAAEPTGVERVRSLLRDGVAVLRSPLKSYDVKTLRPIHKQIIALSAAGAKNREIAEMLDVGEAWVSTILRHPESVEIRNEMVAEYVTALHGDARDMIAAHTSEAIQKVVSLMRSSKDNIQLLAAKDILDRGGFKPQERIVSTNINLTAGDAAAIQDALREMSEPVPELQETEVTAAVFSKRRET